MYILMRLTAIFVCFFVFNYNYGSNYDTILFRSTGPIAVARRRSVGRSVCLSVNTCNSATNVRIFFKIGGNIPWVNITRRFFRFCKIFNFEFLKK